jgi:hypothetical protein
MLEVRLNTLKLLDGAHGMTIRTSSSIHNQ